MTILSTLFLGAAVLAEPDLSYLDEDDFRESVEALLGRPREWRDPTFKLFPTCASSHATEHTMAEMTVDFTNSCEEVSAEITARANGDDGWKDPHNRGQYAVLATEGNLIKIKRRTGNDEYTDVQTFSLVASGTGCNVQACSVSQGNSNDDQGTNMCDMMDLFCNSANRNPQNGVSCQSVKTNLQYKVEMLNCGRYKADGSYRTHQCQPFLETCLRDPEMPSRADKLKADLGRPREWRDTTFKQWPTCASSGATEHTMAQMTVDFSNSCSEVAAEVTARGNMDNGWVDPHNRGHYAVLATEGNLIKIKRRTGNDRYTDVQTFALTASGTGCHVQACSVSQGNSNDDQGTNMCDMMDLFCNDETKNPQNGVHCQAIKYNLQYTVPDLTCGRYKADGNYFQHDCQPYLETCLRNPTMEIEMAAAAPLTQVVLSRPPEWRDPSFNQFATCPGSNARAHTMAQMNVKFTNGCQAVANEIKARANGENGWVDPHNRGRYAVLNDNGNLVQIKRRTGNDEYTDYQTFSLVEDGTGCNVQACSVSQGNSNNDQGTNMCDMEDLFCNSEEVNPQNNVRCQSVITDLKYTISNLNCGRYNGQGDYLEHDCQPFLETCLRNPMMEALSALKVAPTKVIHYLFN